jgi:hypothetical protein
MAAPGSPEGLRYGHSHGRTRLCPEGLRHGHGHGRTREP